MIETLQITPFDARRWVATTSTGHRLLIGEKARAILIAAAATANPEDAFREIAISHPDVARDRFDATLERYRQLLAKPADVSVTQSDVCLLSPSSVRRLASPFRLAFHRLSFLPVFAVTVLLSSYLVSYQLDLKAAQCALQTPLEVALVTAILLASALVHELGHAAALIARGGAPGAIGIGMYRYVLPVAHVELNDAWTKPRNDRLVVNLGGITLHLLFGIAVAAAAEALPVYRTVLHGTSLTIFAMAALQLLPFLRCDGYWLLTDFFNTPNLSSTPIRASLRRFASSSDVRDRARIGLALLYVIANTAFLLTAAYLLIAPVSSIFQIVVSSMASGALDPTLLSLKTFMTVFAFGLVGSALAGRFNQLRRLRSGDGSTQLRTPL